MYYRIGLTTTKALPRTRSIASPTATAAITKRSFHVSAGALHLRRTALIPSKDNLKRIVGNGAIGVGIFSVGYVTSHHQHDSSNVVSSIIEQMLTFGNRITASDKRNTEDVEEGCLNRNNIRSAAKTALKDGGDTTTDNTLEVAAGMLQEGGERIAVSRYELI